MIISVDNLVPGIAWELQVQLYGRDIFIQFEISNKNCSLPVLVETTKCFHVFAALLSFTLVFNWGIFRLSFSSVVFLILNILKIKMI